MKIYVLYLEKEENVDIKRAVEIISALTLITCNVKHSKIIFEMTIIFKKEILFTTVHENELDIVLEVLKPYNLKLSTREYEETD